MRSTGRSVERSEQMYPGPDGHREVENREHADHAMPRKEMQYGRAAHREGFGDNQRIADAQRRDIPADDRIRLDAEAEMVDPDVGERTVEELRGEERQQDGVAEQGTALLGGPGHAEA